MNPETSEASSRGRRIATAVIAADVGAVVLAVGGVLALSAGLVVIAAFLGVAIGWLMKGQVADPRAGSIAAVAIALGGVLLGQLLLWLAATLEGGVLGPIDYLGQTFGILVPAEFVAAAIGAWLAAR